MNDYILKYESGNEWLSHTQEKGAHWYQVTKYVGKYYIPKSRRGLDRAKEQLSEDRKHRQKQYNKATAKLWKDRESGELSEEKHKKLLKEERSRYEKDKRNFDVREDKIDAGYKKADVREVNRLRNKDRSQLTNAELDKLNTRLKKERQLDGGNNKKKNKGNSSPSRDLVKSAENLSDTLHDISRNARNNAPIKKPKKIDLSDKSDEDIRRMISRAKLEQEYSSVVNTPQTRNGRANAMAALAAVGTIAVVGTQVADFVITAKKLKE